MTTENPLGPQFQFSWNKQDGKKFQTKAEVMQSKVRTLAQELQGKYFTAAQESTRKVAAELRAILTSVEAACLAHDKNTVREPYAYMYMYIQLYINLVLIKCRLCQNRRRMYLQIMTIFVTLTLR